MNEYKMKALKGMSKIIKDTRPQAREEDDAETLAILDRLESQLENDKPTKAIQTSIELKKRCEDMGYATNIN